MQNKRKMIVSLLVVVFLLCSLAGCSSPAAPEPDKGNVSDEQPVVEQKPIELKMADFFPANHKIVTTGVLSWIDAVEEATDGKVKITHYPGETLLKAGDIHEGVASGIADIGHTAFAYNIGRYPLMQVFGLPGIELVNSKANSYAVWDMIVEGGNKYEGLQDFKFLHAYGLSPGALHTKKPINSLEDLKGLEVRVTPTSVDTMTALGAVPIAMPMSETYESLSKGIVQGALVPIEALEGWNLAEVTGYTTIAPVFYSNPHHFVMNLDVWNSLSPDIQQAIESVSKQIHEEVTYKMLDEIDEAAITYAEDEAGQDFSTLSESEKNKIISLLEPLQDKWAEEMENEGLPGREILDEFKNLAAKYNKMFP